MKYLRCLASVLIGLGFMVCASIAWADDAATLNLAVTRDDSYGVSKMLERGVDPNLKEPQRGETPLMVAIREKAMRSIQVLLASPKTNIEAAANNGDTALMIASYTRNVDAVKALLAHDAEVNRHGWAPLHYAAAVGDVEIIQLLLDKSAYVDVESPNKTTPLMMAARGGNNDAAKALIEAGADLSLKNDQGMTAVDFARNYDHRDTAALIESAIKPAPGGK
ncbi:MAG TPA: ankyrin repeat domain-containing protein [Burkholderiaceae bacterium]